jgi:hypothetical protein
MKKNSIKFSFALTFSLFCRSKYVLVTMLNIFQCMLKKKIILRAEMFYCFSIWISTHSSIQRHSRGQKSENRTKTDFLFKYKQLSCEWLFKKLYGTIYTALNVCQSRVQSPLPPTPSALASLLRLKHTCASMLCVSVCPYQA